MVSLNYIKTHLSKDRCVVFLIGSFFLQGAPDRAIAFKAGGGNFALGGGSGNGAFVNSLANVSAIGILTTARVGQNVGKGGQKLIKIEEIKSCKIYKRKARGISKEACGLATVNVKDLNVSCGVSAALYFTGDLSGCKSKAREKGRS